jgi:hypothetical protein
MSKIADIMRAGKALIEDRGWGRGDGANSPRGCYCVLTAIAGDEKVYHYDAVRFFERANGIGPTESGISVIGWNDAPGRTQEEVLAAFDKAITLAEQENV